MSAKQDRSAPRTVADIERKYNFGKSFAELIGLIDDTRKDVEAVESTLRNEIIEQSTTLKRDTEKIVATATQTLEKKINDETVARATDVASLQVRADEISASVAETNTTFSNGISDINGELVEVKNEVAAKMTSEEVILAIRSETSTGISLETGYTFDADGLKITKGSAMENVIDDTGMYVKRRGVNVLVANESGVEAYDLHAKTYLIVGSGAGRSRFEDYGINRTGCFWIGG